MSKYLKQGPDEYLQRYGLALDGEAAQELLKRFDYVLAKQGKDEMRAALRRILDALKKGVEKSFLKGRKAISRQGALSLSEAQRQTADALVTELDAIEEAIDEKLFRTIGLVGERRSKGPPSNLGEATIKTLQRAVVLKLVDGDGGVQWEPIAALLFKTQRLRGTWNAVYNKVRVDAQRLRRGKTARSRSRAHN